MTAGTEQVACVAESGKHKANPRLAASTIVSAEDRVTLAETAAEEDRPQREEVDIRWSPNSMLMDTPFGGLEATEHLCTPLQNVADAKGAPTPTTAQVEQEQAAVQELRATA